MTAQPQQPSGAPAQQQGFALPLIKWIVGGWIATAGAWVLGVGTSLLVSQNQDDALRSTILKEFEGDEQRTSDLMNAIHRDADLSAVEWFGQSWDVALAFAFGALCLAAVLFITTFKSGGWKENKALYKMISGTALAATAAFALAMLTNLVFTRFGEVPAGVVVGVGGALTGFAILLRAGFFTAARQAWRNWRNSRRQQQQQQQQQQAQSPPRRPMEPPQPRKLYPLWVSRFWSSLSVVLCSWLGGCGLDEEALRR